MAQLDSRFSAADREVINQAVQDAESQTSAEVIPVIALSSGRYDRSEDVCGLWCGILAFVAVWFLLPDRSSEVSWEGPSETLQLVACIVAIVVGFVLGAVSASRVPALRRLFTSAAEMRAEVQLRARAVFFDRRVHHTACATGILLYVSMTERMAVVLADQAVTDALGQSQLDTICHEFTQRLHAGQPIAALAETIRDVGQQLAKPLQRAADDTNELSDALVVLD